MENLELQLKQQIIEALNLEEITAEEIATDAPLFGEGLGLDSIDALELRSNLVPLRQVMTWSIL